MKEGSQHPGTRVLNKEYLNHTLGLTLSTPGLVSSLFFTGVSIMDLLHVTACCQCEPPTPCTLQAALCWVSTNSIEWVTNRFRIQCNGMCRNDNNSRDFENEAQPGCTSPPQTRTMPITQHFTWLSSFHQNLGMFSDFAPPWALWAHWLGWLESDLV